MDTSIKLSQFLPAFSSCRLAAISREREKLPETANFDRLGTPYRADFVCYGSIIVELKAVKSLTEFESAQVLHYLKATALERALLINFGAPRVDYRRFIQSKSHLRPSASSAVAPQPEGKP